MRTTTLALPVVAALAAGFALGWFARPAAGPVATDPSRAERAEGLVKELEAKVARLEADAREAASREAQRLSAARPLPARPADAPAAAPAEPPPVAKERDPKAPIVVPEGFEEIAAAVDWGVVGRTLRDMTPLLAQFAEEWARTGTLPANLIGRLNEMNAPLVTAALSAAGKLKLPMTRANTAFTHPVFGANAIASMLEAAGKPLSPTQLDDLRRLAERYAAEDAARLAGYDDRVFALQKSIDESVLRDRFYTEAFTLLTDEQRALLAPEAARGRLQADLFSSALVWAPRMQVLPFTSSEGLEAAMRQEILRHFQLKEEQSAAVRDAVGRWLATLPTTWLSEPPDAMAALGMVHVRRIEEAARLELKLLDDLLRTAGLDAEKAAAVRGTDFVMLPVRTAPK